MCKIQPKSGKLGKGSGSTLGTNATWAENLDLEAFSNDVSLPIRDTVAVNDEL